MRHRMGLWLGGFAIVMAAAGGPESAQASPAAPPRPAQGEVSPRTLENWVAFARLYGFVRYFHPSDQAQPVDWLAFAVTGFSAVQDAPDTPTLARRLEALFHPIAPLVQIFPTGRPPALPSALTAKPQPGSEVVCWLRVGSGEGSQTYQANRPFLPVEEGLAPGGYPPPDQPYEAELGGGLSCRVPVTLYARNQKTLPAVAVPAPAPLTEKPADVPRRLAIAASAWNVLQHFYPYHELNRTEWRNLLPGALQEAATAPDEVTFVRGLERLVAQLEDGHGNVYKARRTPMRRPGLSWAWIEERLVVTRVAAELAHQVRPGDVVTALDGRDPAVCIAEEAKHVSGATPQWIRHKALDRLISGPPDTTLTLTLEGGRSVALARRFEPIDGHVQRPELGAIAEVDTGLYYVSIARVTDAQFEAALPQLTAARGVILDLREYPDAQRIDFWKTVMPRLTTRPLTSVQFHTPLAFYPDRQSAAWVTADWTVDPKGPHIGAKLAFLADAGSISQMELWLDIVRHHRLGPIVGEPTAGTDGEIDYQTFGAYTFVWTGMKVLKHDGSRSHGVGIAPDVPVRRTIAGIRAGRDEVLEAAVRAIR